ncbi:hypothetical protein CDL15_Pgr008963 [Punica granatum]|uniref:Calmodulin-binding protein 60 A-like n=1 Tax=Punica granatum TaxID=22663 RepID=A0A218VYI5_PUNGR|nr:hypothetical protein CDL15_Pgr008963 [Punica granatum]
MSQKRRTEEAARPDDKRRRFPNLKSVILEVMRTQSIHLLEQMLEPSIRKVVKEEVEQALLKHFTSIKRSCEKEVHPSEARSLQLQFLNTLSRPVFTGARIEGAGNFNIKIALVDCSTGKIVDSGPESSAKVEIVVLEGDFGGDGSNGWTPEEFKNNIVKEREGRRPLLAGDLVLNLKDGVALVDEITFSDNSSWTRSRRFRLGVRVIDKFDGIDIKEAKTEPFIVRDHRGELYKKHHPPSLLDEVWRLEKIGKEGAFHKRLAQANIKTVKDFLIQLFVDASKLRDILSPGMSSKMWEVTEEHARTCVLNKSVYLYCPHSSELKTGVSLAFILDVNTQADANEWLVSASQHWGEVVSFDSEASMMASFSRMSSSLCSQSSLRTDSSSTSRFLANNRFGFDCREQSASSPDVMSPFYSFGGIRDFDDSPVNYDQPLTFPSQVSSSILSCDSVTLNQDFSNEDHLLFFEHQPDLPSIERSFTAERKSDAIGKAQRRWRKLFNVLKWIFVRNLVSRKNPIQDAAVSVKS